MEAIAVALIIMVGLYIIKPTHITIRHEHNHTLTQHVSSHVINEEVIPPQPMTVPYDNDADAKDPNNVTMADTMRSMQEVMVGFTNVEREAR